MRHGGTGVVGEGVVAAEAAFELIDDVGPDGDGVGGTPSHVGPKDWSRDPSTSTASAMAHVAMQEADASGQVVTWLEHVTDEEYEQDSGAR
jgi:hypothetical protein